MPQRRKAKPPVTIDQLHPVKTALHRAWIAKDFLTNKEQDPLIGLRLPMDDGKYVNPDPFKEPVSMALGVRDILGEKMSQSDFEKLLSQMMQTVKR